jgi:hypothetical protein
VQAIDSFIFLYHQFDITVLYSQTHQTTCGSLRHQTFYFKYGVSVADTPVTADTIADTLAVVYDCLPASPPVDIVAVSAVVAVVEDRIRSTQAVECWAVVESIVLGLEHTVAQYLHTEAYPEAFAHL